VTYIVEEIYDDSENNLRLYTKPLYTDIWPFTIKLNWIWNWCNARNVEPAQLKSKLGQRRVNRLTYMKWIHWGDSRSRVLDFQFLSVWCTQILFSRVFPTTQIRSSESRALGTFALTIQLVCTAMLHFAIRPWFPCQAVWFLIWHKTWALLETYPSLLILFLPPSEDLAQTLINSWTPP